jgi:hypothetical protein
VSALVDGGALAIGGLLLAYGAFVALGLLAQGLALAIVLLLGGSP